MKGNNKMKLNIRKPMRTCRKWTAVTEARIRNENSKIQIKEVASGYQAEHFKKVFILVEAV